jgi:hypothetical protein
MTTSYQIITYLNIEGVSSNFQAPEVLGELRMKQIPIL